MGKVLAVFHVPLAEVTVETSAPVEHSVKILHVGNIPFGKVVIEAFFLCEKTRHVRHTASVPGGNGTVFLERALGFLIGFSVTNFTPCSANVFLALGAPWHKAQHMVAEFFGETVHGMFDWNRGRRGGQYIFRGITRVSIFKKRKKKKKSDFFCGFFVFFCFFVREVGVFKRS